MYVSVKITHQVLYISSRLRRAPFSGLTAVKHHAVHPARGEQSVQRRQRRVEALRGEVERAADGAALCFIQLSQR